MLSLADDVLLSTAPTAIEGCVLFLRVSVLASGAVSDLWDVANTISKETSASCTSRQSHACVGPPVLLASAIPVGLNHGDRCQTHAWATMQLGEDEAQFPAVKGKGKVLVLQKVALVGALLIILTSLFSGFHGRSASAFHEATYTNLEKPA